jgi:hypothetical protein
MEFDFSQFHPLDHWPGTRDCRSFYGGTRNHLKMTWSYRRKPELRSYTVCLIGLHRWRGVWSVREEERGQWKAWKNRPADFEACGDCGKSRG